jgi:hypothetical protein
VKNFPKDFFTEDETIIQPESPACSLKQKSVDCVFSTKKLRPLKLNSKLMRIQSPGAQPESTSNFSQESRNGQEPVVLSSKFRSVPKQRKRNFNKSLSLGSRRNISMTREASVSYKNEYRPNDSPVVPLSMLQMKHNEVFKNVQRTIFYRRPKMTSQKGDQSRKNILHLLSYRQKNVGSANHSLVDTRSFAAKSYNSSSFKKPREHSSERQICQKSISNFVNRRTKFAIKPFKLYPTKMESEDSLPVTRNSETNEEFSLPEIFTKDSVLPSTNESDRIKDDTKSDKSSDDSVSYSGSFCSPTPSV